ncbi:hypothetical protein TVAG_441090 [Trichomonas vaginalis G3]|uniref:Uncharacterized protein n=1 Tax=Trichomonas vaginalis (strain ATCC PRA-98 / G3) TaxID=412133 RepID=A2FSS4_TRIV3|nr:hypothetical protein TVAGG3_0928020 [Trichomonas vaginalis G3]EAX92046.1 hypothetical protein TVAG_441090 [Trichomonas vaginalis G3]KAI5485625.1 hypothetical protein TVAGG3_0928020 [Trichomonas vaginalis G3]|eukprot:XP_001304976.1 hypothetical protein [Trichomonas vaginalis G3]
MQNVAAEVFSNECFFKGHVEMLPGDKLHIIITGDKSLQSFIKDDQKRSHEIWTSFIEWKERRLTKTPPFTNLSKITFKGVHYEYDPDNKTAIIEGEDGCIPVLYSYILEVIGITGSFIDSGCYGQCNGKFFDAPELNSIIIKGNIEYIDGPGFTRVYVFHDELSYGTHYYGANVKTLDFSQSKIRQLKIGYTIPQNLRKIILPQSQVLIDCEFPEFLKIDIENKHYLSISKIEEITLESKDPLPFYQRHMSGLFATGAVIILILIVLIIVASKKK